MTLSLTHRHVVKRILTRLHAKVWARDKDDPSQTEHHVESVNSVRDRGVSLVMQLERESCASGHHKTFILVSHGDTSQILQTQVSHQGRDRVYA